MSSVAQIWGASARVRIVLASALASIVAFIAVPAAAQASGYVALGDSFSSGVGTREYYADSGDCQRSPHAYPVKYAAQVNLPLSFVACSGARTQNVLDTQLGPLDAQTQRVTITIGGNDAGFAEVITRCALPWPWTCWSQINSAQNFIRNTLPGRLDSVYSQIRQRAPSAVVGVLGYPRLFNEKDECNFGARISIEEQKRLNETADLLRDVTRGRALAHGFTFIDSIPAFVGHAVCDPVEWVNGLSNPVSESYHPNRLGQDAYTSLTVSAIG